MSEWTEVKALLPNLPADWSLWVDAYERHGFVGTVQTDHPPTLSAYVAPGDEEKIEPLRAELIELGAIGFETSTVKEENWAESWKQFFKQRRVGDRFVICPSWEEPQVEEGDLLIHLDPGQAFGTGDHPTTRGCLEQLEKLDLAGCRVADIGCGSGILSVGAILLGAESVVAVDMDGPSVEATIENAERNSVAVETHRGEGFAPIASSTPFDVVVSNIISAAIIRLAHDASQMVKPGGFWIVSGIIVSNWPDVQSACKREGFVLVENQVIGEWVAATFRRSEGK